MVQLKIILDTRRMKSDGTYPIMFRITNRKQVNYISFGVAVLQNHWDEASRTVIKLHPNAQTINTSLSKKYYEIQKAIVDLENEKEFSFDALKEKLATKNQVKLKPLTFIEFANKLISEQLTIKKTGNAMVYQTSINSLIRLYGSDKIKFEQVTYTFINDYNNKLIASGVKQNTISNYLRTIRAIYNKAIKAKLVERIHYPFAEFSIKGERTAKRAISLEALKGISNLSLKEGSQAWHSRNFFLLSFSLIGISFTDLAYLNYENIKGTRLIYKRRKTHKVYDIKLTAFALKILDIYDGKNSKYLLPILPNKISEDTIQAKALINLQIKTTNKYLKRMGYDCGLTKPLTTYVSRHTWATTAKHLGFSKELIAEALGHEDGNQVTSIYLDKFDQVLIDQANVTVLAAIQ